MKKQWKSFLSLLISMVFFLTGCSVSLELADSNDTLSGSAAGSAVQQSNVPVKDSGSAVVYDNIDTDSIDNSDTISDAPSAMDDSAKEAESILSENGTYTTKEDVAAYLHRYHHLPDNFITKKQAKAMGWDSSQGNLHDAAPGMSIGGDYFGNYEGILPQKAGRNYHECDIDSTGGYRGAKRIVFSNDGLIYYTEDHYQTFTLLYGEE